MVEELACARDLLPVVRIGPPGRDNDVRDDADAGSNFFRFTALADADRRVVAGLPLRDGRAIWIEVHNEPNLCYEWVCTPGTVAGDGIEFQQVAHEYAVLLRDVADALHAMGDHRIKVLNGGLAPGGARSPNPPEPTSRPETVRRPGASPRVDLPQAPQGPRRGTGGRVGAAGDGGASR